MVWLKNRPCNDIPDGYRKYRQAECRSRSEYMDRVLRIKKGR
jgi:hypothetical protein